MSDTRLELDQILRPYQPEDAEEVMRKLIQRNDLRRMVKMLLTLTYNTNPDIFTLSGTERTRDYIYTPSVGPRSDFRLLRVMNVVGQGEPPKTSWELFRDTQPLEYGDTYAIGVSTNKAKILTGHNFSFNGIENLKPGHMHGSVAILWPGQDFDRISDYSDTIENALCEQLTMREVVGFSIGYTEPAPEAYATSLK